MTHALRSRRSIHTHATHPPTIFSTQQARVSQLEVQAHRPLRGMYGEDEDDEVYAEKVRRQCLFMVGKGDGVVCVSIRV